MRVGATIPDETARKLRVHYARLQGGDSGSPYGAMQWAINKGVELLLRQLESGSDTDSTVVENLFNSSGKLGYDPQILQAADRAKGAAVALLEALSALAPASGVEIATGSALEESLRNAEPEVERLAREAIAFKAELQSRERTGGAGERDGDTKLSGGAA